MGTRVLTSTSSLGRALVALNNVGGKMQICLGALQALFCDKKGRLDTGGKDSIPELWGDAPALSACFFLGLRL